MRMQFQGSIHPQKVNLLTNCAQKKQNQLNNFKVIGYYKMHIKVLEFFSGIGGFHYALERVYEEQKRKGADSFSYSVLQAFDINQVANKVLAVILFY